MPRSYKHIKILEKEILEMRKQGMSHREIREKFSLNEKQLKNFINRHNRKVKQLDITNLPSRRGRPRKNPITCPEELKLENKRLQMENNLLRDFLHVAGRK